MNGKAALSPSRWKRGQCRWLPLALPLLALSTLSLRPATAVTQTTENTPTIQSLQVDLRPEYDRPGVLVIYRIQLAEEVPLPTTISVPIPAAAGEPSAVGMGQGAGGLPLQAAYTRQVEGDWAIITLETESLGAQVEFYADLAIDGEERRYTFIWPGGVALGSLSYVVQQPTGATEMTVVPPGTSSIGRDGLTYFQADLGPLEAASTATVTLAYRKTMPGLSIDVVQPTSAASATGLAAEAVAPETQIAWLPWAGAALAVVLLTGVGTWTWRNARQRLSGKRRPRRPRSSAAHSEGSGTQSEGAPQYCHVCGTRAGPSDSFCRRCGTRLRR